MMSYHVQENEINAIYIVTVIFVYLYGIYV